MRFRLFAVLIAAFLSVCAQASAYAASAPLALDPDHKLPNAGRPEQRVAFPAIRDWRSLKISLRRTRCFGRCPSYTVEISGDGAVAWTGEAFVQAVGARHARIPVAKVKTLYRAFREAQFFWTLDIYRARITDLPTYTVSISYDDHAKSVIDYAGMAIGMPQEIVGLEQLIDKTANDARWIGP
ncbi:MAG TPA: DUF6438 domain-containing protein [Rhizomicrobium sp.]|jgi:hypothetical protein|nr:DUF6438 domain-containing protein [Rhizomicrobium sp.]